MSRQAILGLLAALASLSGCELLIHPDDVDPPGATDGGEVATDGGCVSRSCPKQACGSVPNGCGGQLNCGKCLAGFDCQANACVTRCTAETDAELCQAAAADCGTLHLNDRCGKPRTPNCGGACAASQVCGGGTNPNLCWCSTSSCLNGTRCEPTTGSCVSGCSTAAQCPTGGRCDKGHCVCDAGTHECGPACVANDIEACGTGCLKCPTDPNGAASCDGLTCSISCAATHRHCGTACAPCPANGTSFTCKGDLCAAAACDIGYTPCAAGCCAWHLEPVTTAKSSGRLGITVDEASNTSHIAFHAKTVGEMRWGKRNAASSWTIEPIETVSNLYDEQIVDLVVAPGGEPVVAYLDDVDLKVGERKKAGASGWTKSVVKSGAPLAPSIALESNGTIHLAFGLDLIPCQLHHASRSTAAIAWTLDAKPLATPSCANLGTSIAFDGSTPIVAAVIGASSMTTNDQVVLYRLGAAGDWTPDPVESGTLGLSLKLLLDASGGPRLAWYDAKSTSKAVRYAVGGATWQIASVESKNATDDVTLALDTRGEPHLLFVDAMGSLRHAWFASGAWDSEEVDTDAAGIAVARSPDGGLRVVYRDSFTDAVRYAWFGPDP